MSNHDHIAAPGSESLPLPNNLHSASGSGSTTGPRLINMANGLKKRFSRNSASPSHVGSASHSPQWWKIRLFQGMVNDLRRRAPYYLSDWLDAWDYRVVPATVYMYFAKYECPGHAPPTNISYIAPVTLLRTNLLATCSPKEIHRSHGCKDYEDHG